MSKCDLSSVVSQYRAGLEAEIVLLRRLEVLAQRQHDATQAHNIGMLTDVTDQREQVMANLVAIEHQLKPLRLVLMEHRRELDGTGEFETLVSLHRQAALLVNAILIADHDSLAALKAAEHARRVAQQAVEQGEHTVAAYRRVVAPPLAGATLVDRKG